MSKTASSTPASVQRRRRLLTGALGAALTLPALRQSFAQPNPVRKIRFGRLTAFPIGALAAHETGIFQRHGIQVELIPLQAGPAAVAATTTGSVDLSFGDVLSWVAGLSNGFTNVRLIAEGNYGGNTFLVARRNSGIAKPADLLGKRIGVTAAPVFIASVKLWLSKNGVDPDKVRFVNVPAAGGEQVLAQGNIDALLAYDPMAFRAEHTYDSINLGDPSGVVVPRGATLAAYYGNAAFIDANPALVRDFVAAVREGSRYFVKASAEDKARITAQYAGFDLATMEKDNPGIVQGYRYVPLQLEPFDVAATQGWVDIAHKWGAIGGATRIAPYVHTSAVSA